MDLNRFTTKAQAVLQHAQELAIISNQQQVDVFHLLFALLDQEDSIVPVIIKKMGLDEESIK